MTVAVTIARQYGSGGREVGKRVAHLLQANYVDKELIALAANKAKVTEEAIAERDEIPFTLGNQVGRLIRAYFEGPAILIGDPMLGGTGPEILLARSDAESATAIQEVDVRRYLELMSGVMEDLIQAGSIVIVGRGGNMILKSRPNVVRVFVVAPLEARLIRVMHEENLNIEQATRRVDQVDSSREAFVKQLFHTAWRDPVNYDLVINTGEYSLDLCAQVIVDLALSIERS